MNTTTKLGEMPDLPADLKREPKATSSVSATKPQTAFRSGNPKPKATPQVPAIPGTAPLGVKAKPEVKAKAQPKATKPEAKAVREPKAKTVKPQHRPTAIERTEANPAKSIVPPSFKARYAEHGDSNGDKVALALAAFVHGVNAEGRPGTDLKKLAEVAKANGIDMTRYANLNVGQQRMNVGNRLRGILKAGKPVTIGKQRFANAETALKVVAKVA